MRIMLLTLARLIEVIITVTSRRCSISVDRKCCRWSRQRRSDQRHLLRGTVVTLTATPNGGWRVKAWSGTDNDSSTATTNTVIMNSDRTVTVEFEQPNTLIVAVGGGEEGYYSNIQDAFNIRKMAIRLWFIPAFITVDIWVCQFM